MPFRKKYILQPWHLLLALLLIWISFPIAMQHANPASGYIDQNIWLLILLSIITFLLIAALCWWLLRHFWTMAGLPEHQLLILKFNQLELWQQLSFLFACYALLLWAMLSCMGTIC